MQWRALNKKQIQLIAKMPIYFVKLLPHCVMQCNMSYRLHSKDTQKVLARVSMINYQLYNFYKLPKINSI